MPVPYVSAYPYAFDNDVSLFSSHDLKSFTLASGIDANSLTMIVNESCAGLTGNFFLSFKTGELVYVTAVSVATKTMTMLRAVSNSSPAPHEALEECRLTLSANILEQMKRAILQIEYTLGLNVGGEVEEVAQRIADVEAAALSHAHTGGADGHTVDAVSVNGFVAASTATANKLLTLNSSAKLPASITGDAATLGGSALSALQKVNILSGAEQASAISISSDAITLGAGYNVFRIDTEAASAADNLKTITGGTSGNIICLFSVATARVVSVISGGNINVSDKFTLSPYAGTFFIWTGTTWRIIANHSVPTKLEYCSAYRTTDLQTTADAVVFNAEEDPWNMHASNSANIVIAASGIYLVNALIIGSTVNDAGAFYGAYVKVNGGQIIGASKGFYKDAYRCQLAIASRAITLAGGDIVTLSYEYEVGGQRYYYADSYLSVVRIG